MSTDVVAQLAHEGVAVSMPILLFGGCRVGAPPRGAAVEHRGFGRRPAAMPAQQAREGGPVGRARAMPPLRSQRLFV